jgi:hypothetical protein
MSRLEYSTSPEKDYQKIYLSFLENLRREGEFPVVPSGENHLLKAAVYAMTTFVIEKVAGDLNPYTLPTTLSGDFFDDVKKVRDDYLNHLLSMTSKLSTLRVKEQVLMVVYEKMLARYAYSKDLDRLSQPENMLSSGIGTATDATCNAFSIAIMLFHQKNKRLATDEELSQIVRDVKRVLRATAKMDIGTFIHSFRGILVSTDPFTAVSQPQDKLIRTDERHLYIQNIVKNDRDPKFPKIGCPINFASINSDSQEKIMLFDKLLDPLFESLVTLYKSSTSMIFKEFIGQEIQ